jgi:hypothetical protein
MLDMLEVDGLGIGIGEVGLIEDDLEMGGNNVGIWAVGGSHKGEGGRSCLGVVSCE